MRILSLWQPWASLIALEMKQYETRSWGTDYREKLLIHATKRLVNQDELAAISYASIGHLSWDKISGINYPLGCVVAIVDLTDCRMMESRYSTISEQTYAYINEQSPLELAVGNWQPGRYAWKLENIIALSNPIPWKGAQGLRDAPSELVELVNHQLSNERKSATTAKTP